jgi:dimethyl sulfoxide reductase iron-sulfur subunit
MLKLLGAVGVAAMIPLTPAVLNGRAGAHEEGSPPDGRQWGMVIDLRKCEGCVTTGDPPLCTEACNLEHSVPPGQEWIRIVEMQGEGGHTYFLPLLCQQCEQAPCVNVCPVGATYHTDGGSVLINHETCIGCRMCMAACPYDVRAFNWSDPPNPPEASFDDYRPEFPVPHRRGTVNKCMLCTHHLEEGKLPACVEGCPMFAIYLADLGTDLATNGQEVVQFSRFVAENKGYRLHAEYGTSPRVWYLPGYGQQYGRSIDDRRPITPARTWIELRELDASRGGDSAHADTDHEAGGAS